MATNLPSREKKRDHKKEYEEWLREQAQYQKENNKLFNFDMVCVSVLGFFSFIGVNYLLTADEDAIAVLRIVTLAMMCLPAFMIRRPPS